MTDAVPSVGTIRVVVSKMTGDGENIVLDTVAQNSDAAEAALRHFTSLLDERLWLVNWRMLNSMQVSKDLPPEVQLKLRQSVEMLYGRAPLDVPPFPKDKE